MRIYEWHNEKKDKKPRESINKEGERRLFNL